MDRERVAAWLETSRARANPEGSAWASTISREEVNRLVEGLLGEARTQEMGWCDVCQANRPLLREPRGSWWLRCVDPGGEEVGPHVYGIKESPPKPYDPTVPDAGTWAPSEHPAITVKRSGHPTAKDRGVDELVVEFMNRLPFDQVCALGARRNVRVLLIEAVEAGRRLGVPAVDGWTREALARADIIGQGMAETPTAFTDIDAARTIHALVAEVKRLRGWA